MDAETGQRLAIGRLQSPELRGGRGARQDAEIGDQLKDQAAGGAGEIGFACPP
jgi:hypothetical protein